jgi:pilus assembly protein CpaE
MRAILICPSEGLKKKFTAAVGRNKNIQLAKILDAYPSRDHLRRVVCVCAPEIVFLDIEDAAAAESIAHQFEKDFPAIQRIALHRSQDSSTFRRVLQLRMRELLSPPFDPSETGPIFDRIQEELDAHPATIGATEHFYAFLPAKAGAGASTIAANATWAFGQVPDKNVLLADLDTSSGVTGFMFNVEHEYSLADAAAQGSELDGETWSRVVKKMGNIDLLLSGAPHIGEAISGQQLARLLEFSRRNYDVVNVDLPDTLNETSLGVLREANRIFLVTTPELTSLRLARLKALLLQKLELHEKASILVNRASKRMDLNVEEIEKTVGLPVFMSFPSDYANVTRAIQDGQPATKLSGAAQEFAEKLRNVRHQPPKKRFIENFAILPLRYGFR